MSDDLLKRLREYPLRECREAADRIEKLEAANLQQSLIKVDDMRRIEKLEAALREIADVTEKWEHDLISQVNEIARKALEELE